MKAFRFILILVLLLASACNELPLPGGTAIPTNAPTPSPSPTPENSPTPEAGAAPSEPVTLRIWLPPQFDPNSGTQAGDLLRARLESFASLRPRLQLEVRVKSLQDPGGLLDALASASAAAPLALPDLVALPRPTMEAAALKGLLYPIDGLATNLDDADWYDFARQLARIQNTTFGVPMAGDALIMIFRPEVVGDPPSDWTSALETVGPLAFPAADPLALHTLALYQAAGGVIQDEQGRPTLNANTLAQVLAIYKESESANLLPLWLTQIEDDEQAWEAYQSQRASMVVTWASRYLANQETELESSAAPIPTPDGTPYTLATGWVWALSNPQPEKQRLAIELAEYLTDPSFLAEWSLAAGYMPTRSSALSGWTESPAQALVSRIVLSSHLIPPADVLSSLGPLLKLAATQVLKQQGDPVALAQDTVDHLQNP